MLLEERSVTRHSRQQCRPADTHTELVVEAHAALLVGRTEGEKMGRALRNGVPGKRRWS